jgi:AraC-like DNA-binding protein
VSSHSSCRRLTLFEKAGTTFADFVQQGRLQAARRMLFSPRFADWSNTANAPEAGLGDLSHFNRRFGQCLERTPSDVRVDASRAKP